MPSPSADSPSPDLDLWLRPVSRLAPRAVEWLWPNRLPAGKLAILDGDPGLGKSLVTLDLCARVSTGQPFPDHSPGPGPGTAIVLNGEDGAEDTIRPRLQALGADLDRVFVLHRHRQDGHALFRFPTGTPVLDQALAATGARLVVIDPITAFLDPSIATGNDPCVRRALTPLACLAEKHACAVLLVRHLNKAGGFRSVYRGGGSIGIVGLCRAAWLVAQDPHVPHRRVLAQVKNNLAGPQPSLTYAVAVPGGARGPLTWLGTSPLTADQLLAAAGTRPAGLPPREQAQAFLAAVLEEGPRTCRELWPLAREQRLSRRTLRRAKLDLGIRSVRVRVDGQNLSYWLLPGQKLPESVPPDAAPPDLEPWLAPLRGPFPDATPLDDL